MSNALAAERSAASFSGRDVARLRLCSFLAYALLIGVVTAIPAVLLAHAMRGAAAGTVYEKHFQCANELFWVALVVSMAAAPLVFLYGLGLAIEAALFVWLIPRVVEGLRSAIEMRPHRMRA